MDGWREGERNGRMDEWIDSKIPCKCPFHFCLDFILHHGIGVYRALCL